MREIIAVIFIFIGSLLQLIAAIGILKFPNLLLRLHASAKSTTLGLGLILVGLGIWTLDAKVVLYSSLIILFIFLSSPTVVYLFAQAENPVLDDDKDS